MKKIYIFIFLMLLNYSVCSENNTASVNVTEVPPFCVLWYKFDGDIQDYSGNDYHAVMVDTPTFAAGKFGQALSFNGKTTKLLTPNTINFDSTNFTLSMWVNLSSEFLDYPDVIKNLPTLVYQEGGRAVLYVIGSENDHAVSTYLGGSESTTGQRIHSDSLHHVAITGKSNENKDIIKIYIDSELVTTSIVDIEDTEGALIFGYHKSKDIRQWIGWMDDIMLFNKALTIDEIDSVMNGNYAGVTTDPNDDPPDPIDYVDPATPVNAKPFFNFEDPDSASWKLVFSDEFKFFDNQKWTKLNSEKSRAPRPDKGIDDWWWRSDHVWVGDDNLVMVATKPDENTLFTGSVNSNNKYEKTYGYFEARFQIAPVTEAVHSAFWMQGDNMNNVDGTGHDGAEIDIFESPDIEDQVQTVFHWDGYGNDHKAKTQRWSAPGVHSGFHIFAMEWEKDYAAIYYDGELKWTYTGVGVPRVDEYLWLSIGASFRDGDFKNGTYPVYGYVDYVRVWQKSDPTTIFENDPAIVPSELKLSQNYPNPFNPTTTISFSLPFNAFTELNVYNMLGKKVVTLVAEHLNAGEYNIQFNASGLPTGIYMYRIQSKNYSAIKKLMLLK